MYGFPIDVLDFLSCSRSFVGRASCFAPWPFDRDSSCPRRRIPFLEASIPRKIFLLLGRCGDLSLHRALPQSSFHAFERNVQPCISECSACGARALQLEPSSRSKLRLSKIRPQLRRHGKSHYKCSVSRMRFQARRRIPICTCRSLCRVRFVLRRRLAASHTRARSPPALQSEQPADFCPKPNPPSPVPKEMPCRSPAESGPQPRSPLALHHQNPVKSHSPSHSPSCKLGKRASLDQLTSSLDFEQQRQAVLEMAQIAVEEVLKKHGKAPAKADSHVHSLHQRQRPVQSRRRSRSRFFLPLRSRAESHPRPRSPHNSSPCGVRLNPALRRQEPAEPCLKTLPKPQFLEEAPYRRVAESCPQARSLPALARSQSRSPSCALEKAASRHQLMSSSARAEQQKQVALEQAQAAVNEVEEEHLQMMKKHREAEAERMEVCEKHAEAEAEMHRLASALAQAQAQLNKHRVHVDFQTIDRHAQCMNLHVFASVFFLSGFCLTSIHFITF